MSEHATCSLLIEAIDEEPGGPLTSEGAALVLRGWEHGQKSVQAELTAAKAENEALRGMIGKLIQYADGPGELSGDYNWEILKAEVAQLEAGGGDVQSKG